ncbi:MAG: hypothetical protein K0R81_1859 [Microbacterium sp.]|nr:hypothetical protein [Microbacterium sp.]
MRRFASVIGVSPENREEYERYHAAVWPGVLEQIEYVGDDYEADMAAMAADPETQRWWAVQEPLQSPVPDRREGEWWHEIPEVFHLD